MQMRENDDRDIETEGQEDQVVVRTVESIKFGQHGGYQCFVLAGLGLCNAVACGKIVVKLYPCLKVEEISGTYCSGGRSCRRSGTICFTFQSGNFSL